MTLRGGHLVRTLAQFTRQHILHVINRVRMRVTVLVAVIDDVDLILHHNLGAVPSLSTASSVHRVSLDLLGVVAS